MNGLVGLSMKASIRLTRVFAALKGRHSLQCVQVVGDHTPQSVQEPVRSFHPLLAPLQVPLRWRGEQAEHAHGVSSEMVHHVLRVDHVALGLGHLHRTAQGNLSSAPSATPFFHLVGKQISMGGARLGLLAHHSLGQQVGEGLAHLQVAQVPEHTGVEPGVEQVQNGVLDAPDVLVHGHPVGDPIRVQRPFFKIWAGVPVKVPGGLHKGVHGIRLPAGPAPAARAGGLVERGLERKGGSPMAAHLHIHGKPDRQRIFRDGHRAALIAVNDGDRGTPVPLPGDVPVPEAIVHRPVARAL